MFKKLSIEFLKVSRHPREKNEVSYSQIDQDLLKEHTIIVNCTPLGTFPKVDQKPEIPYHFLNKNHLLYDLVYNPDTTAFLREGLKRGTQIKNGLKMLELQAEAAWSIWNKK